MRLSFILLIAFLLSGIAGCALPRQAYMATAARDQIPVIDGGKRVKVTAEGWIYRPVVNVRIESPLPAGETLAWYKQKFLAHGWVLHKENEDWTKGYGSMNGKPSYYANRSHCYLGKIPLIKEELRLDLEYRAETSAIDVELVGDYVWDWPGKAVFESTSAVVNAPAAAFLWLTSTIGTGEGLYYFIVVPLSLPLTIEQLLF
jgi:hypothetical protein